MRLLRHKAPVDFYFDLALNYLGEMSHKEVIQSTGTRINFTSGGKKFQVATVPYRGHFGYQVGVTKGKDTFIYFDEEFLDALVKADELSDSWKGLMA